MKATLVNQRLNNSNNCSFLRRALVLIPLVLIGCGLLPQVDAVTPTPDGCYPGFTTAEGCTALQSLTTGVANTAVGWHSLFADTTASYNTGLGAGTLALNNADANTATGVAALILNITGTQNTANGAAAMVHNGNGNNNSALGAFALNNNVGGPNFGEGSFNNAVGSNALFSNVDGFSNNALGAGALFENIHAAANTAIGDLALAFNDVTGNNVAWYNTAVGALALVNNADGDSNTAVGYAALANNSGPAGSRNTAIGFEALSSLSASGSGFSNTAVGSSALSSNVNGYNNVAIGDRALAANQSGVYNTVVGFQAGIGVEGSDNIYIGESVALGITAENNTTRVGSHQDHCYIDGIYQEQPDPAANQPVMVAPTGHLVTPVSSAQFKQDIKPMGKSSEALLALNPVTFQYKNDVRAIRQFGLVAEEVAKVHPELVVLDHHGKPRSVRYDAVNAMLLNEFLKEHRTVQEQKATISELKRALEKVTARLEEQERQIHRVSVRLEVSELVAGRIRRGGPEPKLALKNQQIFSPPNKAQTMTP